MTDEGRPDKPHLNIQCDVREDGTFSFVRIAGDVDFATNAELRTLLHGMISVERPNMRVNMVDVRFIDSLGISALLSVCRRVRNFDGHFSVIVRAHGRPYRVLRMTGVDAFLAMESVEA